MADDTTPPAQGKATGNAQPGSGGVNAEDINAPFLDNGVPAGTASAAEPESASRLSRLASAAAERLSRPREPSDRNALADVPRDSIPTIYDGIYNRVNSALRDADPDTRAGLRAARAVLEVLVARSRNNAIFQGEPVRQRVIPATAEPVSTLTRRQRNELAEDRKALQVAFENLQRFTEKDDGENTRSNQVKTWNYKLDQYRRKWGHKWSEARPAFYKPQEFTEHRLAGVDFRGCTLVGMIFDNATMTRVDMGSRERDEYGNGIMGLTPPAYLGGAILRGCTFIHTHAEQGSWNGTVINGCILDNMHGQGSEFKGVTWDPQNNAGKRRTTSVIGLDLSNSELYLTLLPAHLVGEATVDTKTTDASARERQWREQHLRQVGAERLETLTVIPRTAAQQAQEPLLQAIKDLTTAVTTQQQRSGGSDADLTAAIRDLTAALGGGQQQGEGGPGRTAEDATGIVAESLRRAGVAEGAQRAQDGVADDADSHVEQLRQAGVGGAQHAEGDPAAGTQRAATPPDRGDQRGHGSRGG